MLGHIRGSMRRGRNRSYRDNIAPEESSTEKRSDASRLGEIVQDIHYHESNTGNKNDINRNNKNIAATLRNMISSRDDVWDTGGAQQQEQSGVMGVETSVHEKTRPSHVLEDTDKKMPLTNVPKSETTLGSMSGQSEFNEHIPSINITNIYNAITTTSCEQNMIIMSKRGNLADDILNQRVKKLEKGTRIRVYYPMEEYNGAYYMKAAEVNSITGQYSMGHVKIFEQSDKTSTPIRYVDNFEL